MWPGGDGYAAIRKPQHPPGATKGLTGGLSGNLHCKLRDNRSFTALYTKTEVQREGKRVMEDLEIWETYYGQRGLPYNHRTQRILQCLH